MKKSEKWYLFIEESVGSEYLQIANLPTFPTLKLLKKKLISK
jgi:hypothetical protein